MEDHHRGPSAIHGSGGEWRVGRQRLSWTMLDAFRAAATENGIAAVDDVNGGDNAGCAYFEVNQRRGIRLNTAKAFPRPAAQRPNLTIMTGCHVEKLILQTGTDGQPVCVGVQWSGGGRGIEVRARRETLLAAGAIGSQNHLQLRMVYRIRGARSLNTTAASWFGKAKIGLQYLLTQSGPMSMAPSQLGAFARSYSGQATPTLEYQVQPLSLDSFGDPLHGVPAFTASVCNLRPSSHGHVRIASNDSHAPPKITPNYLSTPDDRRVAAAAMALTRRIVQFKALRRYHPEEIKPGLQYRSDEELIDAAGHIGTTIFHQVGTCRMGRPGDALAVVDSRLRFEGVHGLRVVDASNMPTMTGDTNAPTLMIAEQAAAWIAQDWHDRAVSRETA